MNLIILFDFGGVVGKHHQDPAEKELMTTFGVDRDTIKMLLSEKSEHGSAFRANLITEKQFWDQVCKLSGRQNLTIDNYSALSMIFAQTYVYDYDLLEIIAELRTYCKVGILTNIDYARSNYLLSQLEIKKHFDLYHPSYIFNSHKRESKFWTILNDELSATFPNYQVVYVDDKEEHVSSAKKVGWIGIHHIDNENTKSEIMKRVHNKV